jgi:excisionase family DNA binding protein
MHPAPPVVESPRRGLRIKAAAEYLGSTPWFVEVAIRSKTIPAFKFGRHYVLFREDLDTYIERVRTGVASHGVGGAA